MENVTKGLNGQLMDRTGQKMGILEVKSYSHFDGKNHYWNVQCECGVKKLKNSAALSNSKLKSCGCLTKAIIRKAKTKHGQSHKNDGAPTRTYKCWCGMKARCTQSSRKGWFDYGGRGITFCERWNSFENFLEDMGEAPKKMTLDRINVNGNYEPSNCRWASAKQQANNRKNNTLITYQGKTQTLQQWSDEIGVARDTLSLRIKSGMPLDRAMSSKRLHRSDKY